MKTQIDNLEIIQSLKEVLGYFEAVERGEEIDLDRADLAWFTLQDNMKRANEDFGWARA